MNSFSGTVQNIKKYLMDAHCKTFMKSFENLANIWFFFIFLQGVKYMLQLKVQLVYCMNCSIIVIYGTKSLVIQIQENP